MLYFIKKTITFLLILFIISFALQTVIDEGLKKSYYCPNYKEWYDIFHSRIKSDIVISGSSRAWNHISPKFIESNLGMSTYNLGIDGRDFIIQYCRYKIYEKYSKKKPKYILQVEGLGSTIRNKLTMLEQFIPYLNNPEIKKTTSFYTVFDFKDYYIPLFKYIHEKDIALYGLRNIFNKDVLDNGRYKGFMAFDKKWDSAFYNFKAANPLGIRMRIDPLIYKLFDDFLTNCKKNNIKIILIYTPENIQAQRLCLNRDTVIQLYRDFSKKYNFPFLDYSNDSICYKTKYFFNSQHLNKEGVEIFNKHLVSDLRKIIK